MKLRFASVFLVYIMLTSLVFAEDNEYLLREIVVTGTKTVRDPFELPFAISVVSSEHANKVGFGVTTPDLLRETAGVQVQKTTAGQGSPIIRGLTGYHTVILIDGVRLNNSTFRSGPNQYMATIDTGTIDRIEVLRGQASSLYGSSAISGVMHVITRSPSYSEKFSVRPRISSKYTSANSGKYVRVGIDGNIAKVGFVSGVSYKDVGDLQPGKGYDIQLPSKKFIITSQEKPTNLPEGAWLVDKESPTGWKETNGDIKLSYKVSDFQTATLAHQLVRQYDVPRYDKLATKEFDILTFSPQARNLTYLNYKAEEIAPYVNYLSASISYHVQKEVQKQQKAKSTSQKRVTDITNTLGSSLQITSNLPASQSLTFGYDFYVDNVQSNSITTDLKSGSKKVTNWGTFPDGSKFWDANFFLEDSIKLTKNLESIVSAVLTRYSTESDLGKSGDPAFGMFKESGTVLTGSLGMAYKPLEGLNLTFNTGRAFRAPSLNDTTAIAVTNEGIDAPNPELEPEFSNGFDIGLKVRSNHLVGSINYYFTRIMGLVTRVPLEQAYAGKPIPMMYKTIQSHYEGIPIYVKDNVEKANIQGVELSIEKLAIPKVKPVFVYGNLTFTRGQDITNDKPIRREQPLNGALFIHWDLNNKVWLETYTRFADKQDRLSDGDKRDPRIPGLYADPKKHDPMAYSPGWFTINLRAGLDLGLAKLVTGVENIANRRYREHGSGVDAPGLNFFINLDASF